MKKLLLGTVLGSLAAPAMAGPVLESILPEGTGYSATSEDVTGAGETYEGLVLTAPSGRTATFAHFELARDGEMLNITAADAKMDGAGAARLAYSGLELSVDEAAARSAGLWLSDSFPGYGGAMQEEACAELDVPMTVSIENAVGERPGDGRFSADRVALSYDVIDPDGACIMDATVEVAGLAVSADDVDVTVASIAGGSYAPLVAGSTPDGGGPDYTSSGEINGLVVSMAGQEQARIARIAGTSSADAGSMASLADAGYFDLMDQVARAGGVSAAKREIDFEDYSIPQIWNAVRELASEGTFSIEGAEITGDLAHVMTGSAFLKKGRMIDLESTVAKTAGSLWMNLDLESPGLVDLAFGIEAVIDEMDESLADAGPSALMIAMPVSLSEVAVSFEDQGVSDIFAAEMGVDPYAVAQAAVAGNLEPRKAALVSEWLAAAPEGGAYFAAAPEAPMPVMQVFTGFMGDWSAFGAAINATTQE